MPGNATAALFLSSPMVLVKQETPEKLPTYLPRPKNGTSFRIKALSVVFVKDSLGNCDIRMFLIFRLLTSLVRYKMVNSFIGFLKGAMLPLSGLCKNSPISLTLFPTVFNR